MASALDRAFFDDDGPDRQKSIVVPVPTTGRRSRQRGYNQARLLAAEVARRVGSSCSDALTRVRAAASQTELAPWARRENVRGVFTCSEEGARTVSGMDVVLVDDVLTTGATAGEAAGELGKAGARTVTLLAFARALPRVVLRDAA
jgi:competence protein ComFC